MVDLKQRSRRGAGRHLVKLCAAGLLMAAGERSGAQPLDAYTYKVSHNSYERAESLSHQVLQLNCWGLELDLCWDSQTELIICRHMADGPEPCLFPPEESLAHYLSDLISDERIFDRVTMLYLDIHSFECTDPLASRHCREFTMFRVQVLMAVLNYYLGGQRVYTLADFEADGLSWPSPQELRARGKNFIIFVNKGCELGVPCGWDDFNYFHHQSESIASAAERTSLINRRLASLPPEEEPGGIDRFMWRSYPDLLALEESHDRAHWELAVDREFNLAACNFLDRAWTEGRQTIPAMPMHVYTDASAFAFGTVYRPYPTLREAITRVEQVNTRGVERTEFYPFVLSGNAPAGRYRVGNAPVDPGAPIEIRPNEGRTITIEP